MHNIFIWELNFRRYVSFHVVFVVPLAVWSVLKSRLVNSEWLELQETFGRPNQNKLPCFSGYRTEKELAKWHSRTCKCLGQEEGIMLGAFVKLRKATISLVMTVCPHGASRLPLDGF